MQQECAACGQMAYVHSLYSVKFPSLTFQMPSELVQFFLQITSCGSKSKALKARNFPDGIFRRDRGKPQTFLSISKHNINRMELDGQLDVYLS